MKYTARKNRLADALKELTNRYMLIIPRRAVRKIFSIERVGDDEYVAYINEYIE